MRPEQIIFEVEKTIKCVDGLPGAVSQTREQYIEFRPHPSPSGELGGFGSSEEMVINQFYVSLKEYMAQVAAEHCAGDFSKLTLYWRIKPETEKCETRYFVDAKWILGKKRSTYRPIPVYRLYARLLVSAKLPVTTLEEWWETDGLSLVRGHPETAST